jgi:hypothetical protein
MNLDEGDDVNTTHRTQRLAAVAVVLAAAAGLALVVGGCGGGSAGPGVAQAPTTRSNHGATNGSNNNGGSHASGPAAFSACMRSHGVPNFPDPDAQGRLRLQGGPGTGINPNSPQFQAAQKACQKLLPGGGKAASPAQQARFQQQALRFSACMRAHGVTHFPDPQASNGGLTLVFGKNSGIDPNSPQFKAAQKACQKLLPGGGPGTTRTGGPSS